MTKIIGLTGGIGSGKSTVANYMATKGIPVYIADLEAKKIMEDTEVIQEVQKIFNENVILDNGFLDRVKIAQIVFADKERLHALNDLIHPKVKNHFREWLKSHENEKFIIKEVAILFESGGDKECDKVILVTAPLETRIQRTVKRDGVDAEAVKARIKNQLSDEEKMVKSDYIIENISLNETFLQVDGIVEILKKSQ